MFRAVFFVLTLLALAYALNGCVTVHVDPPAPAPQATPAPKADEKPPESLTVKLSWEEGHPERAEWSKSVVSSIEASSLMQAKPLDMEKFCPTYPKLTAKQKPWVWAELISAMAFYESAWKPTAAMVETGLSLDAVTGKQIRSEGLLQLSYQDALYYKCGFVWLKDKHLSPTDPMKTIFQPKVNLACGVKILARQIERRNLVVVPSSPYWSVIYEGKNSRVAEIKKRVQASPLCKG
jgi:hypothetical protein